MSKSSGAKHAHKRKSQSRPSSTQTNDLGLFVGLLLIGAFFTFLLMLMGMRWQVCVLGFVIFLAFFINLSAAQAVGGETNLGWRKGLARLPLRFAGYGSRGGKPLEAAKGSAKAKMMVFISIAVSTIIVVGMTFWVI